MYVNVPTLSLTACRRNESKPVPSIQPGSFFATVALCCFALLSQVNAQTNNTIQTVAGQAPYSTNPTLTSIPNPTGIAEDASGNIYVASQYSYYLYKVNPGTNTLSVVAGTGIFGFGADNEAATSSTLDSAVAVALDTSGNVYILDGNRIRVVNTQPSATIVVLGVSIPAGYINTVAGSQGACQNPTAASIRGPGSTVAGPCGDGGPAGQALFNGPEAIYIDGSGNILVADTLDERIRFINTGSAPIIVTGITVAPGTITTVAGNGWICNDPTDACGDGGPATAPGESVKYGAKLDLPAGVVTDSAGNVYIGDTRDQRIRCVANVSLGCPNEGNSSPVVGEIVTYAGKGSPVCASGSDPCGDGGVKDDALFHNPSGLWMDSAGNLYVADTWDNRIRVITPGIGGTVKPVCGNGGAGYQSGSCTNPNQNNNGAEFDGPLALIVDSAGNLTIADSGNSLVRQGQLANQSMVTIAGSGITGVGDGGPATSASLANPVDVKWDLTGTNYYIVDNGNNRIREVTVSANSSTISTVAGTGNPSEACAEPPPPGCNGDLGPATSATLDNPNAIAFDVNGNMYIADSSDSAVRVVNMQSTPISVLGVSNIAPGTIQTVAGQMGVECLGLPACGDGGPAIAANVNYPIALALDASGNLYISDYYLSRIRCVVNAPGGCPNSVNPKPAVGTIVSIAGTVGDRGGPVHNTIDASKASLLYPYGLGVLNGGLIFDDSGNNEVRCVALVANGCGPSTLMRHIYDYALTGAQGFSGDGGPAIDATENVPQGLGFDPAGNLYFGGGGDFVARRVDATTQNIMTVAGDTTHPGTPGFLGDGGPSVADTMYLDNLGLAVNGNEYLLIADYGNNRIRQVDMVPEVAQYERNINFGSIPVGQTSTAEPATLQNYGLATLFISNTTITGAGSADFSIYSNTCITQLAPGPTSGSDKSTCTAMITFTPPNDGNFSATLTFYTSVGNFNVNLTGEGVD